MKDPKNLLEGEGDKMRHIKLYQDTQIDEQGITDFIKQALKLNQEFGDPSG